MKLRPGFVLELAVNFLLPWLAYRLALPHLGETGALIASAVPPILWSLVELVRFRRVDALSVMVVSGIVLSVAAMALGGEQRRIVGRVAMNAAVLYLGGDTVSLGDEAVLFGGHGEPSAHSWAESLGITEAEVVTVFGRLLARRYQ